MFREGEEQEIAASLFDEAKTTWGLQATRADVSYYNGKGIRIAVLDTGLDLQHPDFKGRTVISASFIQGQTVDDNHGHGTHCIGIACGPRKPSKLPVYGVAHDADIYAGKVLNDSGRTMRNSVPAGIDWAIGHGCAIISLSLGGLVQCGYSRCYEAIAQRALSKGSLIIAAAGNHSCRPKYVIPVGSPANCPSIMAVGAVDSRLQVAQFSNAGLNPQGGQIDIVAPGVNIHSAWSGSSSKPAPYRRICGTSMATPFVAGIAALFAEMSPKNRGNALANLLRQHARRLPLSTLDVGLGLVQAP